MSSSISFLSRQASLLSYASPNPTNLRTNPWKPYLLPIHASISSSSSAATMSHDSRQNPITDVLDTKPGSKFDLYTYSFPETPLNTESDVTPKLLSERMLFLTGKIDGSVAEKIIFQLMMWADDDPTKEIKLFIDTHVSDSLGSALVIYDVMRFVKADVSTIALGFATQSSSIILCGGTKGKRLAMPNARIMPRNAILFDIQPKKAMHNKNDLTRVSTFDQFQEGIPYGIPSFSFLSPTEAVEYGLIDGIIDRDYLVSLMPVAEKVEPKVN
ncbi:hypothetical protein MRB53_031169 [Persea americana]|uniref:Uncharacterized protein n=1 Tax=Persea americana TaxID=3435 RepID=A0ACC2KNS7_PERAE|nr:hypothetical protein MRB53_031169 [Persea americana]